MTTFKDVSCNETFSFPEPPLGYAGARLGLCVKISARRYQAMGRPTIYTIGTTKCEVISRGALPADQSPGQPKSHAGNVANCAINRTIRNAK